LNRVENQFRRNAIFANMPFQIIASIFMIFPLYIYHAYEKDEPNQAMIDKATKNKEIAITFFYISRFLSGFAAGMNIQTYVTDHIIYLFIFKGCVV
jgi:hypothetical protein